MPPLKGTIHRALLLALPAILLVALFVLPAQKEQAVSEISYSQFLSDIRAGRVRSVVVDERRAMGQYKDGQTFTVVLPPHAEDLPRVLDQAGVDQHYRLPQRPPVWLNLVPPLFWALLLAGLLWQVRRAGGIPGSLPFRSRANRWVQPGEVSVSLQDVAGIDEVKEELLELVDYLKNPERYRQIGAKMPKGVLVYGPPGCGKTLLARAVAGEAGVPFISFSGSEFVELFVGMGAARVRELFAQARKQAPCIIFIDEIDAVGRHRGPGLGGGHEEREQTLNQLLVEMDGFDEYAGVVVMAATNRPDVLDPALLRPGRFDRRLPVDRPDVKGRAAILRVHARNKKLGPDVDLEQVARRTAGFTGADLANLLNEAALLAVRRGKQAIGMAEVEDALERAIAGGPEKRHRVITAEEKRRIAVHEAGHAVVGAELVPPVDKVSIISRGLAGGYTLVHTEEERRLFTRSDLLKRLALLLAGRVAEEMLLGEVSTGASNDLEQATALAREMVTRYGMGAALGAAGTARDDAMFSFGLPGRTSETLAAAVDQEVRAVLDEAERLAREVLARRRGGLERVIAALMEKETLDGGQLAELLAEPPGVGGEG